eukprot:gi/632983261/ref/XP_007908558.1/ PREDICTED: alpha-1B-glycoprotein-like [Callorhinchus milii]
MYEHRDSKFITSRAAPENSNTAAFTSLEIRAGNYSCKYTKYIGGREFTSTESEQVGIILCDPLRKPTITLKLDYRVFVRGENTWIICYGNYPGSKFFLYRDGKLIASQTAPENRSTATFTPSEVRAGNYSCKYTTHMGGREFKSPEGERVGISVWDPLQKANISMQPDTLVFVRGESAEVSCSGNYPGSNFSLYSDGRFITSQPSPLNNNSQLLLQTFFKLSVIFPCYLLVIDVIFYRDGNPSSW